MPVPALEDDAVEPLRCDRYGPVDLGLAAGGEAGEGRCVEERGPERLAWLAPVQEGEERAGSIVDVWVLLDVSLKRGLIRERLSAAYPIIGEEDTLDAGVGGDGNDVLILADLVALYVQDAVHEPRRPVTADRSVADGQDVVAPACACDDRATLLPVHAPRRSEQCVRADVVFVCHDDDEALAQRHGCHALPFRQRRPPVWSVRCPVLMRPVVQHSVRLRVSARRTCK